MSSIHLLKPYKILQRKHKKYAAHYDIPSQDCLVIPVKDYGEDICCDVRWEDSNGELQIKEKVFFNREYLVPIHPILDPSRHEMWMHYYGAATDQLAAHDNQAL